MRGDDWFITPRELEALVKRHAAMERNALVGSAQICAMLANINRDEKKRPEPFTLMDFLPGGDKPEVKELTEHQKLTIKRDEWRRAFVLVGGGNGG